MRDLQRRLGAAGFPPAGAEAGEFCTSTEAALRGFQTARGLPRTGWCDEYTWAALVEASWVLGDRLLSLTSPAARGDDVSTLQVALARLGFDPGKVDGIFGDATDAALRRFQRECGLPSDGVCGSETVKALDRLSRQSGDGPGVAVVREREVLRTLNTRSINGARLIIGQFGGLTGVTRLAARQLRSAGALVVPVDEPDPSVQAQTANNFGADLYLGVVAHPQPMAEIDFYAVPAFESAAGHGFANTVADCLTNRRLFTDVQVVGRRLPILRETRMPAVLCTLGPTRTVTEQAPGLSLALVEAVCTWLQTPRR